MNYQLVKIRRSVSNTIESKVDDVTFTTKAKAMKAIEYAKQCDYSLVAVVLLQFDGAELISTTTIAAQDI